MKTAIQELIDELKDYKKTTFSDKLVTDYWILKAEKMLEKEKEQLLDFGLYVKKNGWVGCKIEDLYEDYYNQKK